MILDLDTCLNNELLISVDDGSLLNIEHSSNTNSLLRSETGDFSYPILSGKPVLFRSSFPFEYIHDGIPYENIEDPYQQYMLLSQIKASISTNLDKSCDVYKHTMKLFTNLASGLKGNGLLVDIGCDQPSLSVSYFPSGCQYIGIDPVLNLSNDQRDFSLVALAEELPLRSESCDMAAFNGSLDHVLDFNSGLLEAHRILKKQGELVIQIYTYNDSKMSTLLTDICHFHHYRNHQLKSALNKLFSTVDVEFHDCPKGYSHRKITQYFCKK